jgi:hypothetical protein
MKLYIFVKWSETTQFLLQTLMKHYAIDILFV